VLLEQTPVMASADDAAEEQPMYLRKHRQSSEDPAWTTARSVPITSGQIDWDPDQLGVIVAQRHATGWFIHAKYRADAPAAELEQFKEFIAVRIYLLLTQGPQLGTWSRGENDGDWLASWAITQRAIADLMPDTVPAHW
jgi:hypothetical protein